MKVSSSLSLARRFLSYYGLVKGVRVTGLWCVIENGYGKLNY